MEIIASTSLRNNYNKISEKCKKTEDPIFLTKNGEGDLVLMSIEAFEKKERLLKLKEELLEVELKRIKGAKDYTIDELKGDLNKALDLWNI